MELELNSKQKKYYKQLEKYLASKGFTTEEAEEAATTTVKMLKASGNDMLFKGPKMMGRMIIREKKRVERGDVIEREDGSLLDTKTGNIYNEK